MAELCALPGCNQAGTKRCSKCKAVKYCVGEHQAQHWAIHKKTCAPQKLESEPKRSKTDSISSGSSGGGGSGSGSGEQIFVLNATGLLTSAILKALSVESSSGSGVSLVATTRQLHPHPSPPARALQAIPNLSIIGDVHLQQADSVYAALSKQGGNARLTVVLTVPSSLHHSHALGLVKSVVDAIARVASSGRQVHLIFVSSLPAQVGGSIWNSLEGVVAGLDSYTYTIIRLPVFLEHLWACVPSLQRGRLLVGFLAGSASYPVVSVVEAARAIAKLARTPPDDSTFRNQTILFATHLISNNEVVASVQRVPELASVQYSQVSVDHFQRYLISAAFSEAQTWWAMELWRSAGRWDSSDSSVPDVSALLDQPPVTLDQYIQAFIQPHVTTLLALQAEASCVCLECGRAFATPGQRRSHQSYLRHQQGLPTDTPTQ